MDRSPSSPSISGTISAVSASAFAASPGGNLPNGHEDREFLDMESAFVRTGGLLSGSDVAHRLRRHVDQPPSTLARWIVARTIVCFEWHSHLLVPMFQFEPAEMTPLISVVDVMRVLTNVFDDWEAALWFARPNAGLGGRVPVDVVGHDPVLVLNAARTDHVIARS